MAGAQTQESAGKRGWSGEEGLDHKSIFIPCGGQNTCSQLAREYYQAQFSWVYASGESFLATTFMQVVRSPIQKDL